MTYVSPCIMYENDDRYPLDATTSFIIINNSTCFGHLYAHLQEYRCVYYCIWCSALGIVAEVLRSRCVFLCTVCKFVSSNWRFTLKINPAPIMHQDAQENKKKINYSDRHCVYQCHRKPNMLAVPVEAAHGSPGFRREQNKYHCIRQPEHRIVCGNNEEHDNGTIYQCLSVNIQYYSHLCSE